MRDFLGNELRCNEFVAAGGAGNCAGEYGMILYRVVSVKPTLKLLRLSVCPQVRPTDEIIVRSVVVTIRNPHKYVRVLPPPKVRDLFNRGVAGTLTPGEIETVVGWIHGKRDDVGVSP